MSDLVIITNHKPCSTLRWYNLTPREQAEFYYINDETRQDDAEFVRYRGKLYDLHDMKRGDGFSQQFKGWDNCQTDSFFSGILVKFVFDGEEYTDQVIMGYYIIGPYYS